MGQNFKFFLKFLEAIKLHWLLHVGFGEVKFSKWRNVCNQSKFLVFGNIGNKGFQKVCLYSRYFFLKIEKDFNINWYFMSPILDTPIHLHQIWYKLWEDSRCEWPLEHPQTGLVFSFNIKIFSYEHPIVCLMYISRLHGRKHKCAFCWMKHRWTWLLSDLGILSSMESTIYLQIFT